MRSCSSVCVLGCIPTLLGAVYSRVRLRGKCVFLCVHVHVGVWEAVTDMLSIGEL